MPLALLAVLFSQALWASTTNFWGYDEWLMQRLLSIGVIDFPYANRPLALLWLLPMPWLMPHDWRAWSVLYVLYAWGSGLLVYALARRLVPGRPAFAFATAALFLVWAPSDLARWACAERTFYMAITCAMLLAILGFLESWRRRSEPLLAAAILMAFAAARSYEAALPLLVVAPFGIALATGERSRAFVRWLVAWESFAVLAGLLIAMPIIVPERHAYQHGLLGLDPRPLAVLERFLGQYLRHLGPLVLTRVVETAFMAAPPAVGMFLIGTWFAGSDDADRKLGWRWHAGGVIVGLTWAGLGYVLFSLGRESGAWRKEFLAGPGIALVLSCAVSWLACCVPMRARPRLFASLASVVVAIGTARNVAMQRFWDSRPYYDAQTALLTRLTRLAPDVRPHTLFVLLDEGGAWRSVWGFRSAVEYLYANRASGWVYRAPMLAPMLMFPSTFTHAGVVCVPWADVQEAWHEPPTLHRYDEIIVVRHGGDGTVRVESEWPRDLPPPPPGARYDPAARILPAAPSIPARAILRPPDRRGPITPPQPDENEIVVVRPGGDGFATPMR